MLRSGVSVRGVSRGAGGVEELQLEGGERIEARSVVLAVPPATASGLLGGEVAVLEEWLEESTPIRAACLDLALSELPRPDRVFTLGIDEPYYLSVHSATARLHPSGGALVHVARYLGPEESLDRATVEGQLEALMDRVQPGWRDVLVERRLLPSMTVTHSVVEAGRPRPPVRPEADREVYLAGDWVGSEGMLADTSAASAVAAARAIAERISPRSAPMSEAVA